MPFDRSHHAPRDADSSRGRDAYLSASAFAVTTRTRIFVAGGDTFIGRALIDRLETESQYELVGLPPREPDLTSKDAVNGFFAEAQPEIVYMAAGLSGGIGVNQSFPADLMLNNLLADAHVLAASARHRVKKLLYLGSSCMYPRLAPQPLTPDLLHTGPLERTSAAYATAKLAGVTLCQAYRRQYGARFITGIPANPFGPFDQFDADRGHVIPALMGRMHDAKTRGDQVLDIWGTGAPRREFIFAADLADACVFVMRHYDADEPINLGSGTETSIADIAESIADVVGFRGKLRFDVTKPDGAPRKRLDSSKLWSLGWRSATPLRAALEKTYAWFVRRSDCHADTPYPKASVHKACLSSRRIEGGRHVRAAV
jgi:GDP-L-fucose synthase